MNPQEEQAKIMAVLRNTDSENNNYNLASSVLAELVRRHLERASMNVTTQVINK